MSAAISSKSNPYLLHKQLEVSVPTPQPYFTFRDTAWETLDP